MPSLPATPYRDVASPDGGTYLPMSPVTAPQQRALSRPLSLRRNFSWTLAGNAIYAASQWAMLMVLAKVGTPEMVGQFSLGLAITAPVILLFNLQLRGIQATDARHEYRFGDYVGLRCATSVVALVVIAGIVLVAGYRGELALVILALGVAKAVESGSDVLYGLLQQRERLDRIAQSMMIKGPLSVIGLLLGLVLTHTVSGGVFGVIAAWLTVLAIFDVRNALRILVAAETSEMTSGPARLRGLALIKPSWRRGVPGRLSLLALPLGCAAMLLSLNTNIPRYFVQHHGGSRQLGIFAAMAYLVVAGGMIAGALGQSASPRLAKLYAAGDRHGFVSLILKLQAIAVVLGVAGIAVAGTMGRKILTVLYTPEYAHNTSVLVWLMVATSLTYAASFLGYSLTAARYFRPQLPLSIFVVATIVVTCLYLVPQHGMLGAAWALLIAMVVQLVGATAILMHAIRMIHGRGVANHGA